MATLAQPPSVRIFWPDTLALSPATSSLHFLLGWATCYKHPRGPVGGQLSLIVVRIQAAASLR